MATAKYRTSYPRPKVKPPWRSKVRLETADLLGLMTQLAQITQQLSVGIAIVRSVVTLTLSL